uniref:Uncharacterized protein n=1 Tax=Arundo donax TaxID=35708 RepID=A0A0A9HB73_ARUDO
MAAGPEPDQRNMDN